MKHLTLLSRVVVWNTDTPRNPTDLMVSRVVVWNADTPRNPTDSMVSRVVVRNTDTQRNSTDSMVNILSIARFKAVKPSDSYRKSIVVSKF